MPKLPSLDALGQDLVHVSSAKKFRSVLRPLLCFTAFWYFALNGWWIPAILSVAALSFITYASTSHDFVHRTLGLPKWLNESLLAVIEGLCLRSGHAFRRTHLRHHQLFPAADDIEAAGSTGSFWSALMRGPGHQTRLFCWAWQHANKVERAWLGAEATWTVLFWVVAIFVFPTFPQMLAYAALVTAAAWAYPLATVWWPHRNPGDTPLTQTRAFRGRLLSILFLEHQYHLEHHLFPQVPSWNWPELARRLEPHLKSSGVTFHQFL